jgi:hypothetical protein
MVAVVAGTAAAQQTQPGQTTAAPVVAASPTPSRSPARQQKGGTPPAALARRAQKPQSPASPAGPSSAAAARACKAMAHSRSHSCPRSPRRQVAMSRQAMSRQADRMLPRRRRQARQLEAHTLRLLCQPTALCLRSTEHTARRLFAPTARPDELAPTRPPAPRSTTRCPRQTAPGSPPCRAPPRSSAPPAARRRSHGQIARAPATWYWRYILVLYTMPAWAKPSPSHPVTAFSSPPQGQDMASPCACSLWQPSMAMPCPRPPAGP